MRGLRRTSGHVCLALHVCALGLVGTVPAGARPGQEGAWPRVVLADAFTAVALRWALDGASRRLAAPACQALLNEFTDQEGRPLQDKLGPLERTPSEYLELVLFRDGTGQGSCRNQGVLAFTSQGNRVVYVCSAQFRRTWQSDRLEAEAAVIHEALHTLGLGENPPTSRDITLRVRKLCAA
jgi:hypothetical protein